MRQELSGRAEWHEALVALAARLGCPDLRQVLFQLERVGDRRLPPGSVFAGRLGSGEALPRVENGRRGSVNSPALALLVHRWRRDGATFEEIAERWSSLQAGWLNLTGDPVAPERRDLVYPAWVEWANRSRVRVALSASRERRQLLVGDWQRGRPESVDARNLQRGQAHLLRALAGPRWWHSAPSRSRAGLQLSQNRYMLDRRASERTDDGVGA
jgi:hypothetical protein